MVADQPVTPDREALNVDRWVEAVLDATCPNPRFRDDFRSNATRIVYKLLPPLTDALDRARQQGRDELRRELLAPCLDDADTDEPSELQARIEEDFRLARAESYQQGRDEAAEAIEGSAEGKFVRVKDYCYRWADDDEPDSGCGESPCPGHDNGDGHHVYFGKGYFAALARGGPNRKDDE